MKRLSIALYFDQSFALPEDEFRLVVEKSYIPLFKVIREKKLPVSMFVSLSLLERLDNLGYKTFLDSIKESYSDKRIELVGGSAYSYLLPEFNNSIIEDQILLTEYSYAYYFGKKGGFEGDPSLMVSDIVGFYPTNLSLSHSLVKTLSEFGYEWVLASNEIFTSEKNKNYSGLVKFPEFDLDFVIPNNEISEYIVNKKDTNVEDLTFLLGKYSDAVVCLPASYFGYSFDQGILLFEKILIECRKNDVEFLTVSGFIEESDPIKVKEYSFEIYNKFQKTKFQQLLWEYVHAFTDKYMAKEIDIAGYEEIASWKDKDMAAIEDDSVRKDVKLGLLLNKLAHIDNFKLEKIDLDILYNLLSDLNTILESSAVNIDIELLKSTK